MTSMRIEQSIRNNKHLQTERLRSIKSIEEYTSREQIHTNTGLLFVGNHLGTAKVGFEKFPEPGMAAPILLEHLGTVDTIFGLVAFVIAGVTVGCGILTIILQLCSDLLRTL